MELSSVGAGMFSLYSLITILILVNSVGTFFYIKPFYIIHDFIWNSFASAMYVVVNCGLTVVLWIMYFCESEPGVVASLTMLTMLNVCGLLFAVLAYFFLELVPKIGNIHKNIRRKRGG